MYTRITSSDNPRLKLVRRLQTRKGRSRESKYVIEGVNLFHEALANKPDIDFIAVSDDYAHIDRVRGLAEDSDLSVCEIPAAVFSKLTDAGEGVGILAVMRMKVRGTEILEDTDPDSNILILDRIQDPGNLGTMIRTAVAAGYGAVIALPGTADIYSPKVLRATAGMIYEIPFAYAGSEETLIQAVRDSGRQLAVTSPYADTPYYDVDLSRRTALVIGNEGRGVSDGLLEAADVKVILPMKGRIESLNAAVSASILMYEAIRKK